MREERDEQGLSRREFLGMLGASFGALAAQGCDFRAPREKIVPHLDQSGAPAPGVSRWYASTCGGCAAGCGALVKSRDGRPIKMEGNPDHPLSRGGLCARGQATVLDLYDSERLRGPLANGAPSSWESVDAEIAAGLSRAHRAGKPIRLLMSTASGPSERAAVERFLARYPGAEAVVYDALSGSAILEAHRRTHGRRALPHYRFDLARAIVSFDADFLGTWISPVEFTRSWADGRAPTRTMSWHAQLEPRYSVTGGNADLRVPLPPSLQLATVLALGRRVAGKTGWSGPLPAEGRGVDVEMVERVASRLAQAPRGRSLVVSGSEDADVQVAVNWLNAMLGNYGSTVELRPASRQRMGDDGALSRLVDDMQAGRVGALLVWGCNPAYDQPRAREFAEAMIKVPLSIAVSDRLDETASLARFACPASHALESWGDAEPVDGVVSVVQPLVRPLFDSRPAIESLLAFCGEKTSAHDLVRKTWRERVFPRRCGGAGGFETFWEETLRRGAATVEPGGSAATFDASSVKALAARPRAEAAPDSFELAPYASVSLGDGRQANNPWLQECPDPVTTATWGNYASFAPEDARRLGLEEGRVVRLSAPGRSIELPAHIQPGQAAGVVAAALGYGRAKAGRIAANFPVRKWLPIDREPLSGADLYPFVGVATVGVAVLDRTSPLAKTQIQDSLADPILGQKRPIYRETTLARFLAGETPEAEEPEGSLWPKHQYPGEKWAMAIDLNRCSGCVACVTACRSENNSPVVGKAEIRKNRLMSWVRVDRYYLDEPSKGSPDMATMPVMCQQCDNAPCETVCPVVATNHTSDGLNAQVYNRCVGTRYCENNCPYKCRRFNWFDYDRTDEVQNLQLNPDVTVRSRGVVEKCTFCVQRIEAARIAARAEGRPIRDGEAMPACAQSCPGQAIVFGDINDPKSKIAAAAKERRRFRLLAELGVGPSVLYQMKVRNRDA